MNDDIVPDHEAEPPCGVLVPVGAAAGCATQADVPGTDLAVVDDPTGQSQPWTVFEPHRGPTILQPETFAPGWAEAALAAGLVALGFVCWEWNVASASLGACLFYCGCLAVIGLYFRWRGIHQDRRSLVLLAIAAVGAGRFAVMDARDIDAVAHVVEIGVCLMWVAYSCRTAWQSRWGGFVAVDWANQLFVVPLANIGRWFSTAAWGLRQSRRSMKSILFLCGGVILCVPVFAIVTELLAQSDDSFFNFLISCANWLFGQNVFAGMRRHILSLLLAVPVAAYVFGSVVGNVNRFRVRLLTKHGAKRLLATAHRVNRVALYGPLAVLAVIYLAYFAAMGSYLFSAVAGVLPGGFSYAEYARRGFFELCGVAAINVGVIALSYILAKRREKEYPQPLRALSAVICVFTFLLVVTALSKLVLYIGTFGLSPLRLYALWFLVLLMAVFTTLIVWHVRPFDAGRPIAGIIAVMVAVICLANTDGIIADYNAHRYLDDHTTIDVTAIADLNDAAVPALQNLAIHAPDADIQSQASTALRSHREALPARAFPDWNLQSWAAGR